MLNSNSSFVRMSTGAMLGIALGVAGGLVFSIVIATISGFFASGMNGNGSAGIPLEVATFLGMGAGAIIGAILGGVHYSRKG